MEWIESPKINPYDLWSVDFWQGYQDHLKGKYVFWINGARTTGYPHVKGWS